jgi:hypothetical protein
MRRSPQGRSLPRGTHTLKTLHVALVALSLAVGPAFHRPALAQPVDAWLFAFQRGEWHQPLAAKLGIASKTVDPRKVVLGHPPHPGTVGEVVVAQSILVPGDELPMPVYADGTLADEEDVFWTAQLWLAEFNEDGVVRYQTGDHAVATFEGRRLVATSAAINSGDRAQSTSNVQVLVNVIAVRSSTTQAPRQSFGGLKARYR